MSGEREEGPRDEPEDRSQRRRERPPLDDVTLRVEFPSTEVLSYELLNDRLDGIISLLTVTTYPDYIEDDLRHRITDRDYYYWARRQAEVHTRIHELSYQTPLTILFTASGVAIASIVAIIAASANARRQEREIAPQEVAAAIGSHVFNEDEPDSYVESLNGLYYLRKVAESVASYASFDVVANPT